MRSISSPGVLVSTIISTVVPFSFTLHERRRPDLARTARFARSPLTAIGGLFAWNSSSALPALVARMSSHIVAASVQSPRRSRAA